MWAKVFIFGHTESPESTFHLLSSLNGHVGWKVFFKLDSTVFWGIFECISSLKLSVIFDRQVLVKTGWELLKHELKIHVSRLCWKDSEDGFSLKWSRGFSAAYARYSSRLSLHSSCWSQSFLSSGWVLAALFSGSFAEPLNDDRSATSSYLLSSGSLL